MNLRDELQSIYQKNERLTPALVVDEWRDKKHPFHDRLEWDNKIAGENWRHSQAQELIRSIRHVFTRPDETVERVREWVSVKREDGYAYQPADEVALDPLVREIVLRDMERDWQVLKSRYGHFAEFVQLIRKDIAA